MVDKLSSETISDYVYKRLNEVFDALSIPRDKWTILPARELSPGAKLVDGSDTISEHKDSWEFTFLINGHVRNDLEGEVFHAKVQKDSGSVVVGGRILFDMRTPVVDAARNTKSLVGSGR